MLLVYILVAVGLYLCLKREVQVSPALVIRGRRALEIGMALVLGGALSAVVPRVLSAQGIMTDDMSRVLISFFIIIVSCTWAIFLIVAERRAQAAKEQDRDESSKPSV